MERLLRSTIKEEEKGHTMNTKFDIVKTPIGSLYIVADNKNLLGVIFSANWKEYNLYFGSPMKGQNQIIKKTTKQLHEYFSGKRQSFTLNYSLQGTEFQQKVWNSLKKIPYGKTISYKEQACLIKHPKAVRAVGGTNGRNPISIILPCHRVIGSNGKVTGYAGGVNAKKMLLKLEKIGIGLVDPK
jgi:methylated-DNA-[protein]-cysteine S-methyltransferase